MASWGIIPANKKDNLVRTLNHWRSKGRHFIDLREGDDGNMVWYCILCRKSFDGVSNLYVHVTGSLCSRRQQTAKDTLMKSNPWPFSDGAVFFQPIVAGETSMDNLQYDERDSSLELIIPGVLQKNGVSNLVVKHVGDGRIGTKCYQKNGVCYNVYNIWCEWIGKKGLSNEEEDTDVVPEHQFAIVVFPYNQYMGREGPDGSVDLSPSSSSSPHSDDGKTDDDDDGKTDDDDGKTDDDDGKTDDDDDGKTDDDDGKTDDEESVLSGRVCEICEYKMLPGKDVAALLNRSNGKLVCSSRNSTGAFHMYHTSCLVYWILLFEVETNANWKKSDGENKVVNSAVCPQCRGTGIKLEGEAVEKPIFNWTEVSDYKTKLWDAYDAWMEYPEELQDYCSLGFSFPDNDEWMEKLWQNYSSDGITFPLQSDDDDVYELCQENMSNRKLVHFYRASE